jgi:hypothetical protein
MTLHPSTFPRYLPFVLLLGPLTFVAGCGGGGPRWCAVSGKVLAAGKTVATGSVTFHPDATRGNTAGVLPVGLIDAQGAYQLNTAGKAGAPPGWYKVTVQSSVPSDPKNPYSLPRSLVARQYTDPAKSPLSIEVKPDASAGAYDLTLTN